MRMQGREWIAGAPGAGAGRALAKAGRDALGGLLRAQGLHDARQRVHAVHVVVARAHVHQARLLLLLAHDLPAWRPK